MSATVQRKAAAEAFKVSERTARKWAQRFESEGPAGLQALSALCGRCQL